MEIKDEKVLQAWQNIVDTMASILKVPTAVITRVHWPQIAVLKTNIDEKNPYSEGLVVDIAKHYCEEVFKNNAPVIVSNALAEEKWKNAPEIEHEMISYLGFPIADPDGGVFGTICVMDNRENRYCPEFKALLNQFRALIEAHLQLAYQNELLEKQMKEIETLRGIIPICAWCKKIRNDEGIFEEAEAYIEKHSSAEFSHAICPECAKELEKKSWLKREHP